jgi:hypothetical protein
MLVHLGLSLAIRILSFAARPGAHRNVIRPAV